MRLALLLSSLTLLAGCSQSGEPAAPPPADAPPEAMLGGVDLNQPLRALGTEPFWGVEITPTAMVYTGVDRDPERAGNPGPVVQGTTAIYTAETDDGTTMVVTLIATECSDGMSDRVYPLTAKVEIGKDTRNGCAASEAFLMTAPAP